MHRDRTALRETRCTATGHKFVHASPHQPPFDQLHHPFDPYDVCFDDRAIVRHHDGMEIRSFHHPDWCPTVIRRRASEELLDMMTCMAGILLTRGRYLWQSHYPSNTAYHSAVYRLRKAGLIAYRRDGGKMPVLRLTTKGKNNASPACRRAPPWSTKWNGIWYVLTFDVPETERSYRTVLRTFLRQLRLGCLQKSVWVTPRDIRPEYDDLAKAGAADEFSYLFESKTVLGRSAQDIVQTAWNMDRLADAQDWYLDVYQDNLNRVTASKPDRDLMVTLCKEELSAYITVMHDDPFLPKPLWPDRYSGERAWRFHHHFTKTISRYF